jgi:hypothetical protein
MPDDVTQYVTEILSTNQLPHVVLNDKVKKMIRILLEKIEQNNAYSHQDPDLMKLYFVTKESAVNQLRKNNEKHINAINNQEKITQKKIRMEEHEKNRKKNIDLKNRYTVLSDVVDTDYDINHENMDDDDLLEEIESQRQTNKFHKENSIRSSKWFRESMLSYNDLDTLCEEFKGKISYSDKYLKKVDMADNFTQIDNHTQDSSTQCEFKINLSETIFDMKIVDLAISSSKDSNMIPIDIIEQCANNYIHNEKEITLKKYCELLYMKIVCCLTSNGCKNIKM